MPRLLHEHGPEIRRRIAQLQPSMTPRWGRMTVDQMLHHVNLALAEALGEHTAPPSIRGIPEALLRFAIIELPWGKGAPTRPDIKIPEGERYDFAAEQERCLSLLDRFLAKPMNEPWPRAANFSMTGRHWSKLQYKHLNHHLQQFGV